MTDARKITYPVQVRVVDGVPQCPCCQEPMVERDGGWMCALGAAALDLLSQAAGQLDGILDAPTTTVVDAHPWQEYNQHGNTCHHPGCRLTEEEHATFHRPRP